MFFFFFSNSINAHQFWKWKIQRFTSLKFQDYLRGKKETAEQMLSKYDVTSYIFPYIFSYKI